MMSIYLNNISFEMSVNTNFNQRIMDIVGVSWEYWQYVLLWIMDSICCMYYEPGGLSWADL